LCYHLCVVKEISPYTIMRGLQTALIGRSIIYHPTLTSTMDAARLEARLGVGEGTVIIAGEQTGGRGRLRRAWLSPAGNIALSIVLYPPPDGLPYLIMMAALAAARAIESVAGLKTLIKWPNDVLIGGKKVGGILIENEMKGKKVAFSIVGIGININLDIAGYPEISSTAASLESGSTGNDLRLKIIRALLTEFDRLYAGLPDGRPIYQAWRDKLITLGKQVKATSGSQVIEGIAESVNETGALLVRRSDDSLISIFAGDVTLREK
jgi:BirA family biotin operon repressor/biotin-[acetyl-CoA-carboxylase] ligase